MNPFNPNTVSYHDYEVLKDLAWHCAQHELKSGQAKTWQIWRDAYGFQFDKAKPENRIWAKTIYCESCKKKTVHRRLLTLERLETTSARSSIPMALAKRIKQLLKFEEAVWIRKMPEGKLQPDHKFPQIRWNTNEEENTVLTDEELRKKFILLTESNNQLKSRNCERCVEKGIRGYFPGIKYWYEGDENWRHAKEDEAGCVGCFWYDPYEWRKKLNELIQNS